MEKRAVRPRQCDSPLYIQKKEGENAGRFPNSKGHGRDVKGRKEDPPYLRAAGCRASKAVTLPGKPESLRKREGPAGR